jgi:hypothetical protein
MPPASLGQIVLSETAHSFLESQQLCESSAPGAYLAVPTSAYSNFKHSQLLQKKTQEDSKYGSVWLGVGDYEKEGVWRTTRGDYAIYAHWGMGQPDGGTPTVNGTRKVVAAAENCVEMWMSGEWNDAPCNEEKHYACQVPGDAMDASTTTPAADASSTTPAADASPMAPPAGASPTTPAADPTTPAPLI